MSESFKESDYLKFKGRFPQNSKIFAAMFVDFLVVNFLAAIVLKLYGALFSQVLDRFSFGYIGFALYLGLLLYVPLMSSLSQTVGQRLYQLKIVKVDGSKFTFATACARWFLSIVSPFGYNHKKVPWFDRKFSTALIHQIRS